MNSTYYFTTSPHFRKSYTLHKFHAIALQDTPKGVAEWIKLRQKQIVAAFKTGRDSVPAYNTIRRTLADTIKEEEVQDVFRLFLYRQYGGHRSILVSLDGKTLSNI